MTAREKAEHLRQEAIKELLDEKKAIEEMLKTIGYDAENKASAKRRSKLSKDGSSLPAEGQEGLVASQPEV